MEIVAVTKGEEIYRRPFTGPWIPTHEDWGADFVAVVKDGGDPLSILDVNHLLKNRYGVTGTLNAQVR